MHTAVALFTGTSIYAQNSQDCADLFISELFLEKNPNIDPSTQNDRPFDLNYAVEIFNPTQVPIDLIDYSIDLVIGNSVTIIPLSGSIAPGDVYVLGNQAGSAIFQTLADSLTPYLDLESTSMLMLKHNNDTLDKFGQDGSPTPDVFDIVQFTSDPYNYLQTIHIDVNDFQNLDLQRGMSVTHGDNSFSSSTDLVGNWAFIPNSNSSDLGIHYGLCNKPAADDIFGFAVPTFNLIATNLTLKDPLTLEINGFGSSAFGSGNLEMAQTQNSAAQIAGNSCPNTSNAELNWDLTTPVYQNPCAGYWWKATTTTYTPNAQIGSGYNFSQKKSPCILTLISHASDVKIDPARSFHSINIQKGTSVKNSPLFTSASVINNNSSNSLEIKSDLPYNYKIVDLVGRLIVQGSSSSKLSYVNTSDLVNGVYIIYLTSSENSSLAQKFIKF